MKQRHETPPPKETDFEAVITRMQDARDRATRVSNGHCYCPEEKTGH